MSGEARSAGKRARLAGRVVVATHNPGKLSEIRELLTPYGVEVVGAAELDFAEPEETGATYRDNAALKAEAAARASGIVGKRDEPRAARGGLGLQRGVVAEGRPRLVRLVETEVCGAESLEAIRLHELPDLPELAGIVGRHDDTAEEARAFPGAQAFAAHRATIL